MGHISHTLWIPFAENWPRETSIKKMGNPRVSSKIIKGIKKAPGMEENIILERRISTEYYCYKS